MKKPELTVITTVHNGENYLEAGIACILQQTFTDFEYLIVDDGSTDQTAQLLKDIADQDQRVKIITNETNLGLTKSLNLSLGLAQGRYLARHDCDDFALPNRLAEQYEYLNSQPNFFLCGTDFDYIDSAGRRTVRHSSDTPLTPEAIAKRLPKKNCYVHSTIMFRNEGVKYREKFYYSQDYDLYLMLLTSGKRLGIVPKKLVQYRWDPYAISFSNRQKQHLFAVVGRRFYQERLRTGQDSYDSWNEQSILTLPNTSENKRVLLEDRLTFCLQNGQPGLAGAILTEATAQHVRLPLFKRIAFQTFIRYPALYSLYRRLRYHE